MLYVLYNLAATAISVPAGRHGDRFNPFRVLATAMLIAIPLIMASRTRSVSVPAGGDENDGS